MSILITGGTGYIGSHTVVSLIEAGHEVVIVDNLVNSDISTLDRIQQITGVRPAFYEADLVDLEGVKAVFEKEAIESVIHFAALKAVGESVEKPLAYYRNNLIGTLNLLEVMKDFQVKDFVFSSSATVYGSPKSNPIREDFDLSTTNPYGATKLMVEDILRDMCKVDPSFNVAILRYFNPVGAHISGLIGESPNGIPNNLMPYITKVATGQLPKLSVFGGDYGTHDGTGVRDYIHVVDLAQGHVRAVEKLRDKPGLLTVNLGTGVGYSVLDLVKAFEQASGASVPYEIVDRRPGDIASCYADPAYAKEVLGWTATKGIKEMCEDSWRWESSRIK